MPACLYHARSLHIEIPLRKDQGCIRADIYCCSNLAEQTRAFEYLSSVIPDGV